jgi:serpin B
MKKKDWNEGLNHLDPDLIEEYVIQKEAYAQKKKRAKPYWFTAVAAMLALAISLSAFLNPVRPLVQSSGPAAIPDPSGIQSPGTLQLVNLVAGPEYPEMVQKPNYAGYGSDMKAYNTAYDTWHNSQRQQYDQPDGYADSLKDFFYVSMAEFLKDDGNPTYSPLNVYMAMAMLAETTGGNSRQQILDLFGVGTIEQLREQASCVWNAHYNNDGETTLLIANSIWLDDFYTFHQNTTDLLANQYFASSFHGNLGTDDMNKRLQTWLDANTGGLLKDQAQNVELDPSAIFALASTVYFSAGWDKEFYAGNTKEAVFHCQDKDLLTPFMNQTFTQYTYYWGENFGAIYLGLTGNNKMWLILPDKGHTVEEILESDDYLSMTLDPGSWENQKVYKINLSLPKFDVVSQKDLIEGMKNLGVTDIFDSEISNFTPMTDTPDLYVGQINHAARVAIDEEGCIAAAFTVIATYGNGMPADLKEIDFTLDRPFLFVVSSRDNLPLFAGIVNEP